MNPPNPMMAEAPPPPPAGTLFINPMTQIKSELPDAGNGWPLITSLADLGFAGFFFGTLWWGSAFSFTICRIRAKKYQTGLNTGTKLIFLGRIVLNGNLMNLIVNLHLKGQVSECAQISILYLELDPLFSKWNICSDSQFLLLTMDLMYKFKLGKVDNI